MRILVGVDDSKNLDVMLKALVSQFHPEDTKIRVMHVVQPIGMAAVPQMSERYAPELLEQKRRAAVELVEPIANELKTARFETDTSVEIGNVTERMVGAAEEWHADLIVLGAHQHTWVERLLLGSTAESIARHARCSVEIVRRPMAS